MSKMVDGVAADIKTIDPDLEADLAKSDYDPDEAVDAAEDAKETLKKRLEKYFKAKMRAIDCTSDEATGCDDPCMDELGDLGYTGWGKSYTQELKDDDGGKAADLGYFPDTENPGLGKEFNESPETN